MKLTDTKVKNAKPQDKPYSLQDGSGLYLEIRPSGSKFWRYRFWLTPEKDGRYTIGEYPSVSLSDARKQREWAREQVKAGLNPTDVRKQNKAQDNAEKANTFKLVAEEWIDRKRHTWKHATKIQVESFLAINAYPAFGNKAIRDVKASEILAVLQDMEKRGSVSSALKVRQWCSAIFCYAVATLRADADPAAALKGAIIPKMVEHSRALSAEELKEYFLKLQGHKGLRITSIALELLPFTFVRQAELRNAEWWEFNLSAKEWTIADNKMKMARTHRVPLSDHVIKLIDELKGITGKNRYLFPNTKNPGMVMSDSTINRAICALGYPAKTITAHDFRATASTRLHEMGYRHDVIERQLAHAEQNKVSAAYNHAEYMKERRELMRDWSDWLLALMPPTD
ncbi:TPA: tyrosine-type recombinase/integrase [Yersinia enterocolitica]|nr:tyrosine-type recombinase/integrase [Yersinia enterocolitica]HEM8994773.1 tyrosine-type recombinase/integrase [Yersinia enterocolitica]HEO8477830.1 tyrosine-type recombinase/integrase [Yersinia enterocolitica]